MEFITELEKQEENNSNDNCRGFKALEAGNYTLSIQGSDGHYCSPRILSPAANYAAMEIAIFGKQGQWLKITKSSVLRLFPRYDELVKRADGLNSSTTVFGYVSVDLINDLYLYLKNQ